GVRGALLFVLRRCPDDDHLARFALVPSATTEPLHQARPWCELRHQDACGDVDASLHDLSRHHDAPGWRELTRCALLLAEERACPGRLLGATKAAMHEAEIRCVLEEPARLALPGAERRNERIEGLHGGRHSIDHDQGEPSGPMRVRGDLSNFGWCRDVRAAPDGLPPG